MSNFYIIPILTKESYCYLDEEFIDFAFWKQDGIEMFVEISVEHEKKPCWKEINELEFMLEFKKMKANLCGYEIYERESYVCDMGKIAIATIDYFISNIKTLENLLIDINQKPSIRRSRVCERERLYFSRTTEISPMSHIKQKL